MDYQHNPFVLIARITVKEGKVGEYMAIANDADNAVKKSEPGMLLHTFDADPNDKHKFVWTEVYRKSADFLFHADNPPVQDYVNKHADLADHFSIEIYYQLHHRDYKDLVQRGKSVHPQRVQPDSSRESVGD